MAINDNGSPTIDVVRAVAEKIARDTGRSILDVTVSELGKDLTGSAGYLGAHLQTIKIEYARAARFDTSRLPALLVSGLCEVLEMFQKRGEETGRCEGKISQELFDQVCLSNTALEATVAELERQLSQEKLDRRAEKLEHDTRAQGAQVEIQSLTNSCNNAQQSLADATQKLSGAQYDLGAKTARVEELEKVVSAKDHAINTLNERLTDTIDKYKNSAKEVSDQKQRADLFSLRNEDLNKEKERLQNDLTTANNRAAAAEAELKILKEKASTSGKKNPSAPSNK